MGCAHDIEEVYAFMYVFGLELSVTRELRKVAWIPMLQEQSGFSFLIVQHRFEAQHLRLGQIYIHRHSCWITLAHCECIRERRRNATEPLSAAVFQNPSIHFEEDRA